MTIDRHGVGSEPRERRRRHRQAPLLFEECSSGNRRKEDREEPKDRSRALCWQLSLVWGLVVDRARWVLGRRRRSSAQGGAGDATTSMAIIHRLSLISDRCLLPLALVNRYKKSNFERLMVYWAWAVLLLVLGVVLLHSIYYLSRKGHRLREREEPGIEVVLSISKDLTDHEGSQNRGTLFRIPIGSIHSPGSSSLDFGGLESELLPGDSFHRQIDPDDSKHFQQVSALAHEEEQSLFVAYKYWNDEEMVNLHFSCRRPSWVALSYPTCNGFHELDLSRDYDPDLAQRMGDTENEFDNFYVSHGFYRDVWVNTRPPDPARTILKTMRTSFDIDYRNMYDVRREALVMERLTAYSQIISIYGYCGTSVVVEPVPYEVEEYIIPGSGYRKVNDQQHGRSALSMNRFSAKEKLHMALEMAESIAVLHGFSGGVIVHDDIQLQQWLRAENGQLKLGDFNRAAILDWDWKEQKYCKYSNGEAFGNVSKS
jgi:hypothetical protein